MSQHDMIVDNASGSTVRADLNLALQALASNNSGASEPTTMYGYEWWADTTSGYLKRRNGANDAWYTVGLLDTSMRASAAGTDTYAITLSPAINAYVDGMVYYFAADVANTGACSININAVGATAIKKYVSGALADLATGDIIANQRVLVVYDSTATCMIVISPMATPSTGMTDIVSDTTPQLGGDLDLNEFNVALKEAPASDHTASGIIVSMTYGESIAIGQALYFKSDGKVYLADADGSATYPCMGIALETASSGSHKVLLSGIMRDDTWAWTVGGALWLSTTAGSMTQTEPSAGDRKQALGVATHADRILFSPSSEYYTIAAAGVSLASDAEAKARTITNKAVSPSQLKYGYPQYAIICDQKAQNTAGGTFTAGAFQTRDLNTEISDSNSIVSISSNRFTLGAGTYRITAYAPASGCGTHIAKLYNVTDSSYVASGTTCNSQYSTNTITHSIIKTPLTIASSKAFEIRHACGQTWATNGFGFPSNLDVERYTLVFIEKLSD